MLVFLEVSVFLSISLFQQWKLPTLINLASFLLIARLSRLVLYHIVSDNYISHFEFWKTVNIYLCTVLFYEMYFF